MYKKFLSISLFLSLLLTSCSISSWTYEVGVAHPDLTIARVGNPEDLECIMHAARFEKELGRVKNFGFELGTGPKFIAPTNQEPKALAWDVAFRLFYDIKNRVQPYLFISHGLFHALDYWEPQKTLWGFTTQLGAGFRVRLLKRTWVHLDYRHFHESNGADFFGDKYLPNPGFEAGSVWFGFTFKF